MSYQLDPFPTWSPDEFRSLLAVKLRGALGENDRDRLHALEVAMYVPPDIQSAIATEMVMDGASGPYIQVAGYLRRRGDENTGKAFRFIVPQRLKWADLSRFCDQVGRNLRQAVAALRREEMRKATTEVNTRIHARAAEDGAQVHIGVDLGRPGGDFSVETLAEPQPDGTMKVIDVKETPACG
jgi:hypothetical protein